MTSPWPLAAIIVAYLTTIKVFLPAYMSDRKAFELRLLIKWYNVIQIIANAVVTWGILTSGWTTTYHFGCMLPDYSMNPEALRMLSFLWWTIILKLFELFETVFFLLRKKEKQASFLHIYHHVSTLIIIWSAVKYVGGGITSFSPMINNAVHVIMYSYYLLSSEGSPAVKSFLIKYKKWLTIMQMVQFTLMILYSVQVFFPSCPAPLGITVLYFPNVIFVYYMFYNFFKQNYGRQNNMKKNEIKNHNDCKNF
ncbi:elongation of very long chain fatty acids protein 7-like isoform X2 [Danaus plexippus]|nr:elongation of very long chain fatty acids protein 7-like isoform X2 [Danaus plexippus]XP_061384272.1 elongation of very long chain fatty acids protein 7-like isoform X2 [Danaus plexippus]XP_061384273.1 elongation of very long chain fatty acids protein 7-like isoform X2 [Danaus plexippus]